MSASTPAVAVQPQHMSTVQRMLAVFYAPTRAFADLKGNTRWYTWVAPWLVLSIVIAGFAFAVQKKVGFQQVLDTEMRLRGPDAQDRLQQAPPQQRARAMKFALAVTAVATYSAGIVAAVISLIIAAVLLGTFTFGVGAQLNFKTSLAVVMYASLVDVVRMVLAIITLFAGIDPEAFFIRNPVATNPGYFISFTNHPALWALLTSLDVFRIWSLVLMGIGFAAVTKMKRSTALGCIFGWYVIIVLVQTGIAAIFG